MAGSLMSLPNPCMLVIMVPRDIYGPLSCVLTEPDGLPTHTHTHVFTLSGREHDRNELPSVFFNISIWAKYAFSLFLFIFILQKSTVTHSQQSPIAHLNPYSKPISITILFFKKYKFAKWHIPRHQFWQAWRALLLSGWKMFGSLRQVTADCSHCHFMAPSAMLQVEICQRMSGEYISN